MESSLNDEPTIARPKAAIEAAQSELNFHDQLFEAAVVYHSCRRSHGESTRLEDLTASFQTAKVDAGCADLFLDAFEQEPEGADRLAGSIFSPPEAGQVFLDFKLLKELGRGAIGRVFLAKQGGLADRYVALKIAPSVVEESQTLAQMQHSNIVPIHSFHRAGLFQAVCMPYLGATTLSDVLGEIRKHDSAPDSGRDLVGPIRSSRSGVGLRLPQLEPTLKDQSDPPAPNSPEIATERTQTSLNPVEMPSEAVSTTSRPPAPPPPPKASEKTTSWALDLISSLDFVPAVLWIGARLADGLAFAHSKGIIHGDLKPANVLMTDDGQPMLLDFNLSTDLKTKSPAEAWAGGTLPYMAPEHLQAIINRAGHADVQCDIYSLGVILYELLTGRRPFPVYSGSPHEIAKLMADDRMGPPPPMRRWNRAVTPSVKAIVLRCLAPDPAQRYATARELFEDLSRQLEHKSLRYAIEPASQKTRKWVRRHRALVLGFSIAASFAVCFGVWQTQAARLRNDIAQMNQAQRDRASFERLHSSLLDFQTLICDPLATTDLIDAELTRAESLLQEFGGAGWRSHRLAFGLGDKVSGLREDLGELALLAARASARFATPNVSDRSPRLKAAFEHNALAEAIYQPDAIPAAVWVQRARLETLAGRPEAAKSWQAKVDQNPPTTLRERYLAVLDDFENAHYDNALSFLRRATLQDATNPQSWLLLGNLHVIQSKFDQAVICYDNALTLNPKLLSAYRNRGLLRLERKEFAEAAEDFTRVIQLDQSRSNGWVNRALARIGLGQSHEAIEDLTFGLKLPDVDPRCWFIRSDELAKLGDKDGALRDRAQGLALRPINETGWLAHGLAQLSRGLESPRSEMNLALADIEEGLKLNPKYSQGWFNKASILATMGQNELSLASFDQSLRYTPNLLQALLGRGVIAAREGMRDRAIGDAERALTLDGTADTLYRSACVYALTSRQVPNDAARAIDLLGQAFQSDARTWLPIAKTDADLDPLRDAPDFQSLLSIYRDSRDSSGQSQ